MIDENATPFFIFLVLYLGLSGWLWAHLATKRIPWLSRYSSILLHVSIRLASECVGIAFAVYVWNNWSLLVAYLILSAEGYFTLVYCTFRFLIRWHRHNLADGISWLEPIEHPDKSESRKRWMDGFLVLPGLLPNRIKECPMAPIHSMMILANVLIITGGSYIAGGLDSANKTPAEIQNMLNVSKGLRTAGQAIFFVINLALLFCITRTIRQDPRPKTPATLKVLLTVWVALIIRGIFGLVQAAYYRVSYSNEVNYTANGFSAEFIAIESTLTMLPEWLSCLLLISTYYTDRIDSRESEKPVQGSLPITASEKNQV